MKRKQQYNPLIDTETTDIVAPNRRTFRALVNGGMKEVKRVGCQPVINPDKRIGGNKLTQEMREFLAREYGSKTGKLKKKHIRRHLEQTIAEINSQLGENNE